MGLSLNKLLHRNRVHPEPRDASLRRCRLIAKCIACNSGDGVNVAAGIAQKWEPGRPCLQLLEPLKALWDQYPLPRPPSSESDPLRARLLEALQAEIALLAAEHEELSH